MSNYSTYEYYSRLKLPVISIVKLMNTDNMLKKHADKYNAKLR